VYYNNRLQHGVANAYAAALVWRLMQGTTAVMGALQSRQCDVLIWCSASAAAAAMQLSAVAASAAPASLDASDSPQYTSTCCQLSSDALWHAGVT
jgi:type IV pilus biogenesis protein CpaD/CtpE